MEMEMEKWKHRQLALHMVRTRRISQAKAT